LWELTRPIAQNKKGRGGRIETPDSSRERGKGTITTGKEEKCGRKEENLR